MNAEKIFKNLISVNVVVTDGTKNYLIKGENMDANMQTGNFSLT